MRRFDKFAVPVIALGLITYWVLQRGPSYLSSYFAALEIQALQDAARLYGGRFLEYTPRHLHPPLTSALLGLWTQLGDTEKILRLFPVLCGWGTLVIYISLLRRKYGLSAAGVAGIFFVVSWGFVVCHVGVLNYGWPLLVSIGMIALYARYLEKQRTKILVALGILSTIGIFSNYTTVFLAVAIWGAIGVYDLLNHGRISKASVLAALLAITPAAVWMIWHKRQLPGDTAAYLAPISLGGGDVFTVLMSGTSHFVVLLFPCEWHWMTGSAPFLAAFGFLLFFGSGPSRWILLPTAICTIVFLLASLLMNFPWDTTRHRFPLLALYSLLISDVCIQTLITLREPVRKHGLSAVAVFTVAIACTHFFYPDWEANNSKLRNANDVATWRATLLADERIVVSDQATWDRLSWYISRKNVSGFHFPLFPEQIHDSLPFRVLLAPVWNFQTKESCKAVSDLLGEINTYGGWRVTSLADMADQYGRPSSCIDSRPGAHKWQAPSAFIVSYNLLYSH